MHCGYTHRAASRGWKGQGTDSPLKPLRGITAPAACRLLSSRTVREETCVVVNHPGVCANMHRAAGNSSPAHLLPRPVPLPVLSISITGTTSHPPAPPPPGHTTGVASSWASRTVAATHILLSFHAYISHLAEDAPGAYGEVSNLARVQGHQGQSLEEKPSKTDWEGKGSHGPTSQANLDTLKPLPGGWLSKDVNQASGLKCCHDFRRDQGEMEIRCQIQHTEGVWSHGIGEKGPGEMVKSRKGEPVWSSGSTTIWRLGTGGGASEGD